MTVQNISRREYTAADVKQIDSADRQLFADHPDIAKDPRTTDKIDDYFQTNREVPVTLENIYRVVGLSSAEAKWYQIAHDNPDRARQLVAVYHTRRDWVHTGDPLFENLFLLFGRLYGYEINSTTISHAENRIANNPGKKLQYVPAPPTRKLSEAAQNDDPGRKPGQFFHEHINEPRWAKLSRERSEREAREAAANQQTDASVRSRLAAEARQKAESIQTPSAAETDQLRKLFITISGSSEINWPETLAARERLQQQFTKAREIRRFIR